MGCSSSRGLGGSTNRAAAIVVVLAVGVHVATGARADVRGYGELEEKVSGTDASPAVSVGEGVWGQAAAACLGKRGRAQCGQDRDESRGRHESGCLLHMVS